MREGYTGDRYFEEMILTMSSKGIPTIAFTMARHAHHSGEESSCSQIPLWLIKDLIQQQNLTVEDRTVYR